MNDTKYMMQETFEKLELRPKTKCEVLKKICGIMTSDFVQSLKSDIGVSDLEGQTETAKEDSDKLDKVLGLCDLARTMSKIK